MVILFLNLKEPPYCVPLQLYHFIFTPGVQLFQCLHTLFNTCYFLFVDSWLFYLWKDFFLLSSYWYGLQKFTYPLKLSFQFIVLLYLDFSFQICMQSKHDAHVFFKNSSFLIYCNRFLQLKLHKWLIFDVTYNVVVITIYCRNENSLELSN